METMETAKKICKAAADKKAGNIIIMDMRGLSFSTDYFVVCSAPSAIADNVEEELDKLEVHFSHKEGYHEGEWILLDYGDIVVHIFKNENRDYYALEKLWGDAKITNYEE